MNYVGKDHAEKFYFCNPFNFYFVYVRKCCLLQEVIKCLGWVFAWLVESDGLCPLTFVGFFRIHYSTQYYLVL